MLYDVIGEYIWTNSYRWGGGPGAFVGFIALPLWGGGAGYGVVWLMKLLQKAEWAK